MSPTRVLDQLQTCWRCPYCQRYADIAGRPYWRVKKDLHPRCRSYDDTRD